MVGRALITGASGFVGQALVRRLQQQGYTLRLLQHRASPGGASAVLRAGEPEIVRGSLDDPDSLRQACRDVDTIFHLAAYSHVNQLDPDVMQRVNVEGSTHLLQAAIAEGVRRIVFFSSSLADDSRGTPITHYGQSKREAERRLLQACFDGQIEVCCLRPVNVYGPGMKGNLRTLIRLIRRGPFPPLPDSLNRLSLVGVEDLCAAAQLAAESPRANGQIYCVTDGVAYSMRDIDRAIRQALGRRPPRWSVPPWMLYLAALKLEIVGRVLRLKNAPGLRSYRALTAHNICSNEKISHELGYNPAATFSSTLPLILQQGDV